ncbi:MAG: hypothetical protein AB7E70_20945 [Hyphomicrobiaceae bacterium]
MPAPVPYHAFNKRVALSTCAAQVAANYAMLFRQLHDATAGEVVNVKNVLQAHEQALLLAANLNAPFGTPDNPLYLRAIRSAFEKDGLSWSDDAAMLADLLAVRDAGLTLSAYVTANLPAEYATIELRADGRREEVVKTLGKAEAAALVSAVEQARAAYGDDPAAAAKG